MTSLTLAPWLNTAISELQSLTQVNRSPVIVQGHQAKGLLQAVEHWVAARLCERAGVSFNTQDACGACPACHMRIAGNHPDLALLSSQAESIKLGKPVDVKSGTKPSQEIRIEDVRALAPFFSTTSSRGGIRYVIVYPFEQLNTNSANALLKSLEEPSEHLQFILIGSKSETLLPTIRSRCKVLTCPVPDRRECIAFLHTVTSHKDSETLLGLAMGDPFSALELASDGSEGAESLELRKKWLDALTRDEPIPIAPAGLEKLHASIAYELILRLIADCTEVSLSGMPRNFPWLAPKLVWAKKLDLRTLSEAYETLQKESRLADHPLNPKLTLEFIWRQWHTLRANALGPR